MTTSLSPSSPKLFFSFLKTEKARVVALVTICILMGAFPSIDSILLKNITNLIESYSDENASNLSSILIFWAIGYALWWESINLFNRLYDYIYMKTMPKIKGRILDKFYNYTQYHSHKFFQENLAGQITNRILEAARSHEMIFSLFNEKVLHKIAVITFALIAMFSVHYIFASIFLVWISVFVGLSVLFANTVNDYSSRYARNKALVAGKIVDAIANISVVRMFTSHKFERQYLTNYLDSTITSEQNMQWFMFKLRWGLGISGSVMMFTMIYYLGILRGQLIITIGDCILVLTLCIAVANEVWDLTQEIGDIFEEIGTFNQTLALLTPHLIVDNKDAKVLNVTKGEIKFKNVSFNYLNNNNVWRDKSIVINGKEKIGLVGFSGSGKTTFVSLITRLYDIDRGIISIDGQNIKNVTQESLRDNISIIPQEPILFHRSIMENIRYGQREATDQQVIEAAKLAHAHEFIMQLTEGYNSYCGERGNNLSGGQRQRIVIARAILKNAPILILDEATSALDSNTENLIQNALKYLMENKTVLVIAHRFSTIIHLDRILVFHEGTIVDSGTHEELLKTSKLYKKLWKSQIKGLLAENP